MTETRILEVTEGTVQCLPKKRETLDRCRFCVHSRKFMISGVWHPSPARDYCPLHTATGRAGSGSVTKVCCDDTSGRGFGSILNVIC